MKKLLIGSMAAVAAVVFTGCRMCCDPIPNDPSCIENSHFAAVGVKPDGRTMVTPNIGASKELFRPVFKAGTERITVVGKGTSLKDATNDAFAKFIETAKCDYVIAVTTVVSEKTHPTWRLWATTNYTVTLSGLPIYMEKLACETLTPEKVVLEASTDASGNFAAELKERSTGDAVRKDVDMTPLREVKKADGAVSLIKGLL